MSFEKEIIILHCPDDRKIRYRKRSIISYFNSNSYGATAINVGRNSVDYVMETPEEIDILMGKKAINEND